MNTQTQKTLMQPSGGSADAPSCPFCGKAIQRKELFFAGRKHAVWVAQCRCRKEREEEENRLKRLSGIERNLERHGFETGIYKRMTLQTWKDGVSGKGTEEKIADYIQSVVLNDRNWLYLYGSYGLGKTHIGIAITRELSYERLWYAAFVRWTEYCSRIQLSWGNKDIETDWEIAREAVILLIDDLDKKAPTKWALGQLYELLDYRYVQQLPTILTANHSLKELAESWGSRNGDEEKDISAAIISRILGSLKDAIRFEGRDRRLII